MADKLTVIIPCKDEQHNIRACIESVRALADEILVADSGSTDDTLEIVRAAGGCRIIQRDFVDFSSFKNWAIQHATHPWILIVDADERVTGPLAKEIAGLLAGKPPADAYWIGRTNFFLGRRIRFSGWRSDRVLRLFRRDVCRYGKRRVHEHLDVDTGNTARLNAKLVHYTCRSLSQWLKKADHYTTLAAEDMLAAGRRVGYLGLLLRPPLRFVQSYLLAGGFLDGIGGLTVCSTAAIYTFMKYAKLWELRSTGGKRRAEGEGRRAEGRGRRIDGGRSKVKSWKRSHSFSARPSILSRPHSTAEIALVLSTYQRPWHLQRVLTSIALQQGVDGRMELVVTDDGSTDETPRIVQTFAESVDFPVSFTTHPHETFQLARCRNEGVRATGAPYLLFLDGDCLLPPDHVRAHLEHRRPNCVMGGFCCLFDQATSERIDEEAIRSGKYLEWAPRSQLSALATRRRKTHFYQLIHHRRKTCLTGGNVGIWRSDYERVNGYDENFEGWGSEDDDLGIRLRRAGIRITSILSWTHTYHLWHPRSASTPEKLKDGANVDYLNRRGRLTRCMDGLVQRTPADLAVSVAGTPWRPEAVAALLASQRITPQQTERPEVELLFLPGTGRFSGRAECNVLVVLGVKRGTVPDQPSVGARRNGPEAGTDAQRWSSHKWGLSPFSPRLVRKADIVVSDGPCPGIDRQFHVSLDRFAEALGFVGGSRQGASCRQFTTSGAH